MAPGPASQLPAPKNAPTIAPRADERAAFLGSTRSGKTTLACCFLGQVRVTPMILCDTKGDHVLNRFARSRGFYDASSPVIPSAEHPRVIIHGPPEPGWWDPLFWALFRLRRVLVYVDELTHLATAWNDPAGKGLRSAYSTGGGRGIGVWGSSQRPSGVPTQAFSECDHVFGFRLSWPEDEDTMSRMIRLPSGDRFRSSSLPPYGFVYRTHGMAAPVVCRAIVPII